MESLIKKRIERITEPQIQFLKELNTGLYLAILTTPCDEMGDWSGMESFSGKPQSKSIFRLAEDGFIQFEEFKDVNLRWDICRITPFGREALYEHGRQNS